MAQFLRQSTQVDVRIGPFVDVGDGFTPEVGVTLSGADEAELLKADGAATADISGAAWAAVSGCDGWYDLTLTTSHTDTVGDLTVVVQDDSVCLPVFARFQVLDEGAYDALFAAKGAVISGTVDSGSFSPTTTQFESDDITEATADHYNGRVIVFTSGALLGQACVITDYALSGANGKFTVSTLTEAPSDNMTFNIF